MKVSYKGQDSDFNYRVAEINYDDDNKKEIDILSDIASLMEKLGWKIDIVGCGYASCEVDDIDDYKSFMQDWKECKKLAKKK
jgi:hypothetical protein